MRGSGFWLVGLALLLGACTQPELPPDSSTLAAIPPVVASVSPATVPVDAESPVASPTFCPGRTWPPYPLGGIDGVTAVSTDRQTIEITNRTDRTISFRVSGWEIAQFETCLALGEAEVARGPIAPGTTQPVTVDPNWWRTAVPVTVAFWDERCGEGCTREPRAAIDVELSLIAPLAS
jgi:hypothetical protein